MATATRGKNAITEVMCQSLLQGPDFISCYQEAKFLYSYKTSLVEFFIDTYLDIEKDVHPNLQSDIWRFVEILSSEFDIFLTRASDVAVFHAYSDNSNAMSVGSMGPKIVFRSLFGQYSLRDMFEEYICETLLT